MIIFSILIAAYNAEQTIRSCLDSVFQRKNNDYEVIIVNDGSTDNTLSICKEYCGIYHNCNMFSQSNTGIAGARATGLKYAQGKYVLFCDSDDKYDSNEFNTLLDNAEDYFQNYDMICFNFRNVWQGNIDYTTPPQYKNAEIHFNSFSDNINFISCSLSHKTTGYAVWDKIYKREIIEKYSITPPVRDLLKNRDDWAEDLVFNIQYFLVCKSIRVLENPVYLVSKHGTPETQSEKGLLNRIDHMVKILVFALKRSYTKELNEQINSKFYQILLWHLKRYFYLETGSNGAEKLRNDIVNSAYKDVLLENIKKGIKHWDSIKNKWEKQDAYDYKILLEYFLNGNTFLYKLKNYYLWKIKY